MVTVAVTGVSGFLGQRLLPLLDADPGVGRIVGFDVRDPERRARRLEMHRLDIASAELKPLLEGVDVLVHLAALIDPLPDDAFESRVNVEGTRRVLEAAAGVGVTKFVRLSTAAVYGAWPDNPVPLDETATLRPNPGFGPGVQAAEVERLLAEWRDGHPGVIVTTLRAAPVLGVGAEHLWARLLAGRPPIRVRGASPPVQVVHVDDVASALLLATRTDLPGVYNVAAGSWLRAEDARAMRHSRLAAALPAELLERVLRRLWSTGLGDVPPAALAYLEHPWVIANDRLVAAGWAPRHTNEETLLETIDALPPNTNAKVVAAAVASAGTAAALGITWVLRRRATSPRRR
jgi:UDP-glucose 4-epimerase